MEEKKAGLVPKTYKVNEKVAEEFRAVCKSKGIAMGTQITKMMKEFIDQSNKE